MKSSHLQTNRKQSSSDLLAQLNSNLPVVIPPTEEDSPDAKASSNTPKEHDLVRDAEEDYEYVRSNIKELLKTSSEAISTCSSMALDSEHPRAYEVLSNMIKHTADIAASLTALQKERRKMYTKVIPAGNKFAGSNRIGNGGANAIGDVTNNAIFMGSTTELQKFLKAQKLEDEFVKV